MSQTIEKEKNAEQEELEREGEKVILAIKPHPWFFAGLSLYIVIFTIIILIWTHFKLSTDIQKWIIIISLLIIIYKFFRDFYCWSKTYFLLTSERIISHEQNGLFSQTLKEGSLKDILFISYEKKGITNYIINRGTIFIRTSGVVEEEITLKNIANPYEIEQKIAKIKKIYTGEDLQRNKEETKPSKKERPILR